MEQNSPEWEHIRRGKITGSRVKNLIVDKNKLNFYQLLAERVAVPDDKEPFSTKETERGHELEPEAIEKFEEITGKKVEEIGFCLSDINENIALSPDGLIKKGKTNRYEEAVEVKCLGSKRHLKYFFERKIPKDYEMQVVQYFIVNEHLKKLYFVFYDPRVTSGQIFWVEVTREEIQAHIDESTERQLEILKEIEEKIEQLEFKVD